MYVGNDIVSIEKLERIYKSKSKKFLSRIYNVNEINYCLKRYEPTVHLAGKFAAKEAVRKAISSSFKGTYISMKDINICNKENGSPYVKIEKLNLDYNVQISISHTNKYAIAIAINNIH